MSIYLFIFYFLKSHYNFEYDRGNYSLYSHIVFPQINISKSQNQFLLDRNNHIRLNIVVFPTLLLARYDFDVIDMSFYVAYLGAFFSYRYSAKWLLTFIPFWMIFCSVKRHRSVSQWETMILWIRKRWLTICSRCTLSLPPENRKP